MKRLGIQDRFGQSGAPDALFQEYGLTPAQVAAEVAAFVKGGK
jgi:transketolase C-terminal domain/subunit